MKLLEKTVIVTGGALGFKNGGPSIGSSIAIKFASEGANVIIVDILEEMGRRAVDVINKSGQKALFVKADVTKMVVATAAKIPSDI